MDGFVYRRRSSHVQLHAWAEEESSLKVQEGVVGVRAEKLEFAVS